MTARPITRRSLLLATAGAVAGGLVRPGGVLAAEDPGPPALTERRLGRLDREPVTVELAGVADLVGVGWQGPGGADVELRFRGPGGRFSEWVSAGVHGHAPEAAALARENIGDPVWTGGTTIVQVRATPAVSAARLHLVDVSGGVGAAREARRAEVKASASALALAEPRLQAGAGQPPVIAREAWAEGISPPRVAPEYGAVRMAFVHHTENPNGYLPGEVPAMLRAIYIFHRYVRGWNDIGYNFVLDLYGRIFEARAGGIDEPVVGAHAGGYNLVSTGVAVLGSFSSVPISPLARRALERLLAWKLSLHGVASQGRVSVKVNPAGASYSRFPANARVSLPRIAGHRDADSTDCPGNVLYGQLPGLRAAVGQLAAHPLRVTLGPAPLPQQPASSTWTPAAETPSSEAPASEGATGQILTGAVSYLDGAPVAEAAVLVQARSVARRGELVSEQTLGEALTNAEGVFSLAVTPGATSAKGVWLRALCPATASHGATVSEPVHLGYAVSLSPAGAAPPTQPGDAPPST